MENRTLLWDCLSTGQSGIFSPNFLWWWTGQSLWVQHLHYGFHLRFDKKDDSQPRHEDVPAATFYDGFSDPQTESQVPFSFSLWTANTVTRKTREVGKNSHQSCCILAKFIYDDLLQVVGYAQDLSGMQMIIDRVRTSNPSMNSDLEDNG